MAPDHRVGILYTVLVEASETYRVSPDTTNPEISAAGHSVSCSSAPVADSTATDPGLEDEGTPSSVGAAAKSIRPTYTLPLLSQDTPDGPKPPLNWWKTLKWNTPAGFCTKRRTRLAIVSQTYLYGSDSTHRRSIAATLRGGEGCGRAQCLLVR